MERELVAHTRNRAGEWHALADHLQRVGARARAFCEPLGAPEVGYLVGLWHDVGKAHPQFQDYLRRADAGQALARGPEHKGAGAVLAAKHVGAAAMAIQGHHGGLRSLAEFRAWVQERQKDPQVADALERARRALDLGEPAQRVAVPGGLGEGRAFEVFLRLLFSALVDADFLDTEAHFNPEQAAGRGASAALPELWQRFEARHAAAVAGAADTTVNRVRREVYDACLAAAEGPPGFYRLTVPTGGGKTLSGMAFALRHARLHGQRHIIVAVPFITITQQTADVYRRYLGADAVLEHHSGSTQADDSPEYQAHEVWQRLAAENWDAPVVVTTTVQLFESLFSHRVSACRKLHRLAKSVIVLDEAQALPPHLLQPILDGLSDLVRHFGTTVVLCTATQPAFEAVPGFAGLQAQEIVPQFPAHFQLLRRVRYQWQTEHRLSWAEVADLVRPEPQALAVVNTKKHALALLDALGDPEAFHLSTLLCGAHRTAVLEEVKSRLVRGEPCRLVATQVVEAGVDLDFPVVLRALGPLDSVIQAAGRCNREGRLGERSGRVIVFEPEDEGMPPGLYRVAYDNTVAMLRAGLDPDDPGDIRRYYQRFFQTVNTDDRGIQPWRSPGALDYPKVAERFRMIDDDTVSVVVKTYPGPEQNREVLALLDRLRDEPGTKREVLRLLQPYMVAVRRREAARLTREGLITPVLGEAVGLWHGGYDRVHGLDTRGSDADALIV